MIILMHARTTATRVSHDDRLRMSASPPSGWHQPVMVRESLDLLAPASGHTVVDATVGTGGHSLSILPRLMPSGRLIAIDCDAHALAYAQQRLSEFTPQLHLIQENFRHLPDILLDLGIAKVHGLIADLGMSSLQVDAAERGFSFLNEGPLDMRMDPRQGRTAASLAQTLSEPELVRVLQTYGEERWARRIARRIVESRKAQPIRTTTQLSRVVAEAVPARVAHGRLHPATRTFQALRIVVNDELGSLQALLDCLPEILLPGGRAVILSFHSLEDRLVKRAFQSGAREGRYRLLVKKLLRPSEDEASQNPRARSAKLRAVERLA